MPSINSLENQIKRFKADRGLDISRGQIKTVAHAFYKRQLRMSDVDLERIFMHSDPTPREAIRNIEKQAV